jgi:predicted enzyme related to lactoylglutathione lyase
MKCGKSGGIMKRRFEEHQVINYIIVNSIDQYSIKIKEKGGEIMYQKVRF